MNFRVVPLATGYTAEIIGQRGSAFLLNMSRQSSEIAEFATPDEVRAEVQRRAKRAESFAEEIDIQIMGAK
jgi:hypothetical protein